MCQNVERESNHDYVFRHYYTFLEERLNWIVYAVIQHFLIQPNLIAQHLLSKC